MLFRYGCILFLLANATFLRGQPLITNHSTAPDFLKGKKLLLEKFSAFKDSTHISLSTQADTIPTLATDIAAHDIAGDSLPKKYNKHEQVLYRSLLVPGWGQFYNRQCAKGILYPGLLAGSVTSAILYHQRYLYYLDLLNKSIDANSVGDPVVKTLVSKKNNSLRLKKISLWSVLAVYGIQAFDAYTFSRIKEEKLDHSPIKAGFRSAIFPGWGQMYNGKWWKLPIVYGGISTAGFFLWQNQRKIDQINAEIIRQNTGINPGSNSSYYGYSLTTLFSAKKYYSRYRDISALAMAGLYILNVLDAVVDAHLKNFNVDDDLSFDILPGYDSGGMPVICLGLTYKIQP